MINAFQYMHRVAIDALTAVELPEPQPGRNSVVLRMRAAALNYRDLAIASGHYHVGTQPPLIPLSDGCGEVIEIGAAVTRVRVGDLACPLYLPDWIDGPVAAGVAQRRLGGPSHGVLAEKLCVDEQELVRVPAGLTPIEAATLPVAAVTAWHTLYVLGTLTPGQTLLVQGAGGISTAAIQIASAGGVRVIAMTRNPSHAATLRRIGATDVATSSTPDWSSQVARLAPDGVDAVLTVAGGDTLPAAINVCKIGGQVLLVGYANDTRTHLDIFDAIRHAITIRVATAGHRTSFEALNRTIEQHAIRPVIARVFRGDELPAAMSFLARGGHCGKVVLELGQW